MDRRSFLIGSGALLTSAFVDKADWFLRNQNAVVPFLEVNQTVILGVLDHPTFVLTD